MPDSVVSLTPVAAPAQASVPQVQPTAVPPTPLAVPPNQAGGEFQTRGNDAVIVEVWLPRPPTRRYTIPYPPPPGPGCLLPNSITLLNVSPLVCDAAGPAPMLRY
jgi:hypothetical protein